MKLENVINIVKNAKEELQGYIILIEIGTFYYCFGKNSYILSYFYRIKSNKIQIVRVMYGRRNWIDLL